MHGLPIWMWVGDRDPVHADVIVIIEIQEFFSEELSVIVGNDRVRNPKTKNHVLDEIHGMLGADFSQGLRLDPLSKFIDRDEHVGQAPRRLLEGSPEVQTPHGERPGNGDRLEFLGWDMNLSSELVASSAGSYDLCCIASRSRPIKPCQKAFLTKLLDEVLCP
jgi:hypothetical protein